jgi:uncharacterized YccA/Bax inhibitor family protein
MRSSNPVLQDKTFQGLFADGARMTMNGTLAKAALLLVLVLVTGGWTWHRFTTLVADGGVAVALAAVRPFIWGGMATGLGLALLTAFARRWAGITAPLYAIAEGFALGGLSAALEVRYEGIVGQAVLLTIGVLASMLLLFRTGLIRVTDRFRSGVITITCTIVLLYVVDIGLRAFSSIQIPFIHESGLAGIALSLLVVGMAALNLMLDFDLIQRGTQQGAPKYMEWYGAFALMVTMVWLYLELLRLLSKVRR